MERICKYLNLQLERLSSTERFAMKGRIDTNIWSTSSSIQLSVFLPIHLMAASTMSLVQISGQNLNNNFTLTLSHQVNDINNSCKSFFLLATSCITFIPWKKHNDSVREIWKQFYYLNTLQLSGAAQDCETHVWECALFSLLAYVVRLLCREVE